MHTTISPLDQLIDLEKDARQFGFDWPNREMIVDQAISECQEILEAIRNNEPAHRVQEEIGDLLHTAISLCLFSGFSVENTLINTATKFSKRMHSLKKITKEKGLEDLRGKSIEYMLDLWQEVKKLNEI